MSRQGQIIKHEIGGVKFSWDEAKARRNIRKHGVSFEEAATCMKKLPVDQTDLDVPEIPPDAILRPARHQPSANARIPRKKTMLDLDIDIIAWFKAEAECGGLNHHDHINKALRQYIIDLVGDKPVSLPRRKRQEPKAQKMNEDPLAQKGLAQIETY